MDCILCGTGDCHLYHEDKFRKFFRCPACELIFVPRDSLITAEQEKERYDAHENNSGTGYEQYLARIADGIRLHLLPSDRGLDFGSGKTTLLAGFLSPHAVSSYDIFYHPDESLLKNKYDFVILSEVIEHLRDLTIMRDLRSLTEKFFIKTKLAPATEKEFSNWFYKRDITHVQFFNERSFSILAEKLSLKGFQKIGDDLYLFRNN